MRVCTEALHALVTPVGLLPGVSPHMVLQVGASTETLHALVTTVGLLPGVSTHVTLQVGAPSEALCALVTPVGLIHRVSAHVELQVGAFTETLHALVTPVRLLAGVGTHGNGHLGIVGKTLAKQDTGPALAPALMLSQFLKVDEPLATLQALAHTVVHRQRAQGLQFRCGEEGVLSVHRQWALPFYVDAQDPQLLAVTGHVGGARGVHMQTLRGGAAVSKVIAVFCREENKKRESN